MPAEGFHIVFHKAGFQWLTYCLQYLTMQTSAYNTGKKSTLINLITANKYGQNLL